MFEQSAAVFVYQRSLMFGASLGILSSVCCFYFIVKKLQINQVLKSLLLFASVQQFVGYGIFFMALMVQHISEIRNKMTCFLVYNSMGTMLKGTQTVTSMISIIR